MEEAGRSVHCLKETVWMLLLWFSADSVAGFRGEIPKIKLSLCLTN
jgi:hypothetical protein